MAAHAMPPCLGPVLALINSMDVEDGTDDLAGGPRLLSVWLIRNGLLPSTEQASAAELRIALDLRAGLRALALTNNDGVPDQPALALMRRALDTLPMVASVRGGLRSRSSRPALAALTQIAAGYVEAVASGHWHRLRRCPADDCAWAFWDSSPKGTRRWDVMGVCGNREKARKFAARHAPQPVHDT